MLLCVWPAAGCNSLVYFSKLFNYHKSSALSLLIDYVMPGDIPMPEATG